ncbi:Metallo-dependent phosphatase-like protein [Bipolaris maydis]|nr:Metallo-dependent phosphatase-like protein [Bipolaris maydis]
MKCAQVLWLFFAIAHAAVIQQRALPHYPGIQFSSDRKLSITVFSDLHFGEPSYVRNRQYADLKTIGVMSFVLDNERSDFVVLNGDLVSCEWVAPADANKLIDQIMAPLVDRNLPFGATFGNHDASKTCSTLSMSEHMWWDVKGKNGRKLSFTTQSVVGEVDKVGWSNYFVPVYSSTNGGDLKMLLWFFDSKGGRKYQPTGEDVGVPSWVDERQHGRVIPSLAFVHIPVFATRAFQEKDHTRTANPGINEERIGYQGDVCDSQGNNCKYSGADIPFMKALVETEGLMAVFSGHDHGVDWCMKWSKNLPNTTPSNGNGLKICFNRHSGYGEDMLGKNIVDTWIRLENGKVSGKVTLNNTFGTDQYSATDLSKTSAP